MSENVSIKSTVRGSLEQPPSRLTPNLVLWLVLLAVGLGLVYACVAAPGLPGDEPAHFGNVLFYQKHWVMPVLGEPGVDYEGQMGPLYYYVAAVIYSFFTGFAVPVGFFALRVAGLALIPLLVLLGFQIALRANPRNEQVALCTSVFLALNPTLLSIFSSVQNDALSVVLAMAAVLVSYYFFEDRKQLTRKGIILGVLVAAGVLTKATVVYLALSIPIYALLRLRGKHWRFNITFGITVAVFAGWFFVRNYLLYGDISAQAGLTKFGFTNNPPPTDLRHLKNLTHWLWVIETYYWLPVQYYRDWFHAPTWLRVIVGAFTVSGFAGTYVWLRKLIAKKFPADLAQRHFVVFLFVQYFFCMLIYTYSCVRITHFAPRVTFPSIITYAIVIGSGVVLCRNRSCQRLYVYGLSLSLLIMNAFVLWRAIQVQMPWRMF